MSTSHTSKPAQAPSDYFATTHWTVVRAAGRHSTAQSAQALEELCRNYWYPLYAFIRHQGHSREEAEDLTQAFFARFLKKNYLEHLRKEKGRFRAFLLASLKHFLANEHDRSTRKKRGGGAPQLSLDWQSADEQFQVEVADQASPDKLYDRAWVVALLERVISRLAQENSGRGRGDLFEHLKPFLMAGEEDLPCGRVARTLKMTPGAVRVAVFRLRRRYQEILREEVAQTCEAAYLEDEMRALFNAFAD